MAEESPQKDQVVEASADNNNIEAKSGYHIDDEDDKKEEEKKVVNEEAGDGDKDHEMEENDGKVPAEVAV